MIEIEFSTIIDTDVVNAEAILLPIIEAFERKANVRVRPRFMKWETAWNDLMTVAIQGKGPDVSHIGSTWVSSLMSMNALRSFSSRDVALFGGARAFIPATWHSALIEGDARIWAIPWSGYGYAICYRRDLLQKTGIDEASAFSSVAATLRTVHKLRDTGMPGGIAFPSAIPSPDLLHIAASWVWGADGDLISSDGKRTLFAQPKALEGLQAFFELYRYLPPDNRYMQIITGLRPYFEGQVAVAFTDMRAIITHLRDHPSDFVSGNSATVALTKTPWFGGGNLVIWRHTQGYPEKEQASLALVQHLTSHDVQVQRSRADNTLPVRLDAIQTLSSPPHPLAGALAQIITNGRTYSTVPLWRRVEFQIGEALEEIAGRLLEDPSSNIDGLLGQFLTPLARRLDLTLSQ